MNQERKIPSSVSTPEVEEAAQTTLVIKVNLTKCSDSCWRTFTVPAATTLPAVHDRIIGPVMGWSRGYHAYAFQNPRIGAVLVPHNVWFVDMMWVNDLFQTRMDDHDIPLALLLQKVGDHCTYTYDLGDRWKHELEVLAVIREGEAGWGEVKLLDGAGACPPEDSMGLKPQGNEGYAAFLHKYKSKPGTQAETLHDACHSMNYRTAPFLFDPLAFHIKYHRALLSALVRGPKITLNQSPFPCKNPSKEQDSKCWKCEDSLKPLNRCSKCKVATYCCRDCQAADWKVHKAECSWWLREKVQVCKEQVFVL